MATSTRPNLFVSVDDDLDLLTACQVGRVCDGVPEDHWQGITKSIGLLHDGPDGPVIGLSVRKLSSCLPESLQADGLWDGTRFDVPGLALIDVPVGAVIVAARDQFADSGTYNRWLFNRATNQDNPAEAMRIWQMCLGTGDLMAHYGLGYTLLDLRRWERAYEHLRYYTEIAPHQAWAWRYRGVAAEWVDDPGDARRSYRRALALTAAGGEETDALDLLGALNAQPQTRRRKPHGRGVALWGEDATQPGARRIESQDDDYAAGLSCGADSTGGSPDAVAALRFGSCEVLVCAKGDGGEVASHLALRAMLEELNDVANPAALSEDEVVDLWDQVRVALSGPADLVDGIGSTASLAVAVMCCDAVLWTAVGEPLIAWIGADGGLAFPDAGGKPLDWELHRGEMRSRVRTGSLAISAPGSLLLHTRLLEESGELLRIKDPDVSADMALSRLLTLERDGSAGSVLLRRA